MISKRQFLKKCGTALFGISLFGFSSVWAQEQLETFTIAGWSKPISEITHILAEPELQHFQQQGIHLEYLSGAGGGDAIRHLLSGQADIAFTDPGSFFAALDQGAPLRAVYDIYPQNVFNVVSTAERPLKSAADLKGKKIGVYSLASGTRQNLQILLHQAGLKESDVEVIVTGLLNFGPLMRGQVDATAATDTGLLLAQYRGLKTPTVIQVGDYMNYSSDLFVVHEDDYQNNAEAIQKFINGYRQSTRWMIDNPAQAAVLAQRYAIDGQDVQLNQLIIEARNQASQSSYTQTHGLGTINISTLQQAADTYHELGLLQRPLSIADVVATEFTTP